MSGGFPEGGVTWLHALMEVFSCCRHYLFEEMVSGLYDL